MEYSWLLTKLFIFLAFALFSGLMLSLWDNLGVTYLRVNLSLLSFFFCLDYFMILFKILVPLSNSLSTHEVKIGSFWFFFFTIIICNYLWWLMSWLFWRLQPSFIRIAESLTLFVGYRQESKGLRKELKEEWNKLGAYRSIVYMIDKWVFKLSLFLPRVIWRKMNISIGIHSAPGESVSGLFCNSA